MRQPAVVQLTVLICGSPWSHRKVRACRYEEYLDSQITAKDIYYLEDVEAVRHLVELGCVRRIQPRIASSDKQIVSCSSRPTVCFAVRYLALHVLCRLRGSGEVIKREEFEKRKAAAAAARNARLNKRPKKLASQGKDLSARPLLQARHV